MSWWRAATRRWFAAVGQRRAQDASAGDYFSDERYLISEDREESTGPENTQTAQRIRKMGYWVQLRAFLYKDLYIRKVKRHYIFTLLEIALPVILLSLLVYFRWRGIDGAQPRWQGPAVYKRSNVRNIFFNTTDEVAYAPDSAYGHQLIAFLNTRSVLPIRGKPYKTWDELWQSIKTSNTTRLALNLEHVNNSTLNYTISVDAPGQDSSKKFPSGNTPRNLTLSYENLLLYPTMWAIFENYVSYYFKKVIPALEMQPQPTARYLSDLSFSQLARFVSQFLLFSYVFFVGVFPMQIIQDKSSRIRELLRMMGQSEAVYWHGQFLVGFVCMSVIAAFACAIFAIPFTGYAIFIRSDPFVVFFILLVFSVAAVLQLMLLTVIINGPTMGALMSILTWFLSVTVCTVWMDPQSSDTYMNTALFYKLLSCLLPPCGCYWSFKLIGFWETANVGVQFSNLGHVAAPGDNLTMSAILGMLALSSVGYIVLIFYLDAVIPWQYGVPKHPLFLFQRSYWCSHPVKRVTVPSVSVDSDMFEKAPGGDARPVIIVDGVTKMFGTKTAVDGLSAIFYANQISVILGHNGAGKTTTMNILTGMFPPTFGDMYINGFSVLKDTRLARQSVGLCPQHNVLFSDLTVEEHLRYFGIMKSSEYLEEEVSDLLRKFDLGHKRSTLSKNLSGGMQRKLSMANAMIGGSEILILDEPTAGMDPQARRSVWSVLQEARKTRSILLTTHYMEEADVLGDRIAFLADGQLKCAGSPMFLKKKFDTGYKMRVAKTSSAVDVRPILTGIGSKLDCAAVKACTNQELVLNLGFPDTKTLIELFTYLEDNKRVLGISNIGVSVTTMEDVFLAVGSSESERSVFGVRTMPSSSSIVSTVSTAVSMSEPWSLSKEVEIQEPFPRFTRVSGAELAWLQFSGLFGKRFHTIKRQWWMPLFLFALPIALTILFCYLDEWAYRSRGPRDWWFSMKDIYGPTDGWLNSTASESESLGPLLTKYMSEEGSTCTKISEPNVTEYLLRKARADPLAYRTSTMMGLTELAQDAGNESGVATTLWFNDQPFYSAGSVITIAQRAMFERVIGKPLDLRVLASPRDSSKFQQSVLMKLVWVRFIAVFPISLATAFLTCSIILNPIQENISKAKLIQLMSGVHRALYFGASFLFDSVLLGSSSVVMLCVILFFDPLASFRAFSDTWQAVLLILLLYGYAMTPLSYILSYIFKKPSAGFMYLLVFNVITGSIIVVIMAMLDAFSLVPGNPFRLNVDAVDASIHALNYVPAFSVVWGFVNVHINGLSKDFCAGVDRNVMDAMCENEVFKHFVTPCCNNCTEIDSSNKQNYCFVHRSPFEMDQRNGAGYQMLALFVVGSLLFIVLILIESNPQEVIYLFLDKIRQKRRSGVVASQPAAFPDEFDVEDVDVMRERSETDILVNSGRIDDCGEALVTHGITKYFSGFCAVKDLSFRVHEKECFGLLGVNGAGKTTTFGMLTGDLMLSRGNAYIKDTDLRRRLRKFQQHIGYCPQFDALIDTMTAREMLQLFCALRGVPREQTAHTVSFVLDVVGLSSHADKMAGSYSGGNKRKLSIALALVGNPHVLYLDEPTAGIDPSARRKIWNTLVRIQHDIGSAIVLTSHSMEECETLCHRLCIMVNGRLRCIGSTQHLKSKFGEGFTVLIKLRAGQQNHARDVIERMEKAFPSHSVLRENHHSLLHFHVTDTSLRWSTIFQRVDEIKVEFDFEDVFVSDTTLEQIFLSFAKTQKHSDESGDRNSLSASASFALASAEV